MKVFKVFLREDEIPRQWYNIQADLPTPLQPPLNPGTGKPIGPEDLAPVFPMNLIEQEVSQQRWFDIPQEVMDKLLKIPYFERAYAEDGYTPDEFNNHPALLATAKEFSGATQSMVDFVSKRIAQYCG